MRSPLLPVLTATAALAAPLRLAFAQESGRAIVERAATAIGGRDALAQLTTVDRTMVIRISDPTQGARPNGDGEHDPPFYLTSHRRVLADYRGRRQRSESSGAIYGGQPSRFLVVERADSVFVANLTLGTLRAMAPPAGQRAPIGQFQVESLIQRMLAASDSAIAAEPERVEGGRPLAVVRFREAGTPFPVRVLFDRSSGLPVAIEMDTDDAVQGDVLTRLDLSDWRQSGPLRLPYRMTQRRGGVRYQTLETRAISVGGPAADSLFAGPTGLDPDPVPPQALAATPIGTGGLYLLPAAYNSLFLVADDHVVVLEAPVNSRRSMAALAEIARVAPGKPIRQVVATHFHADHIGGLRPFIALGATIVTTESARRVIERDLIRETRTRNADTLSRAPRTPVIDVVRDRRTLGDAGHRVEVIAIGPNPHADEILIAWLPAERVLFQGDMLDLLVPEGKPSMPGDDTRALAKSIARLGLPVERIVPVHGRTGTMEDLRRTLAR